MEEEIGRCAGVGAEGGAHGGCRLPPRRILPPVFRGYRWGARQMPARSPGAAALSLGPLPWPHHPSLPRTCPHLLLFLKPPAITSWACPNRWPQTGWLPTAEANSPTLQEARSPRPRCQPGWFILRAVRNNLFQAFCVALGDLLGILVLWLVNASHSSLPSPSRRVLHAHMSVSLFPISLFLWTPVILG